MNSSHMSTNWERLKKVVIVIENHIGKSCLTIVNGLPSHQNKEKAGGGGSKNLQGHQSSWYSIYMISQMYSYKNLSKSKMVCCATILDEGSINGTGEPQIFMINYCNTMSQFNCLFS